MPHKKRRSISLMIGGVHSYFTREMIRGVCDQAHNLDLNAFLFLRIHAKPFFSTLMGNSVSNAYDYQFNTILDYSQVCGADGNIVGYGTIGFHMKHDNTRQFLQRYNAKPQVLIFDRIDLPNCHTIISDNRQGMFSAVEHLITEHGCRKILFMRGPVKNMDAIERYQGYLDAMRKYSLPVDDSMVGIGDFSEFVDEEVERLLDMHSDADGFAFSNDEMASSCYRVCSKHGLKIGKDLKITGYDSGDFADKLFPPLTSVYQNSYGIGAQAVDDLVQMMDGETLSDRLYPVTLTTRESCGCSQKQKNTVSTQIDFEAELSAIRKNAADREAKLLEYQRKSWFIPMMARNLNDCAENDEQFARQAMEELKHMNVRSGYLFLLDHPISYDGTTEWECPDNLYLAAFIRNGEVTAYQTYDRPHVTCENSMAKLTEDDQDHQFMVFLLFSGDRQYGVMVCEVPIDELAFFYVVSLQLGLSLHYNELSQVQEMNRRQLTQDIERVIARNQELDRLSGYDQLTGLLNLRGLHTRIRKQIETAPGRSAYIIYCDVDHLKQINDYFGHPEGSIAIAACGQILKKCIRESDILARTGGDEFTCVVISDDPKFPELFTRRLHMACDMENEASDKAYYLNMSIGISALTLQTMDDYTAALQEADAALYEAKKHRRPDIRREPAEKTE